MKTEIKERLIEALNSGAYKKGRNQLRTLDDKYCVNGVLCELAVQEGVIPEPFTLDGKNFKGYRYEDNNGNTSSVYPPKAVLNWADIAIRDALSLALANDQYRDWSQVIEYLETL